ncbi:redox-regulated ATPase YchF [Acidobacteriota bacterium]
MGFRCGIVGLPNVGKSTIFNALTSASADVAAYPFTTVEPNVGIAGVPDRRLDTLATICSPEKTTPAAIEFVDIAGLIKGASKGEGLGNQFLSHIRAVDAIVHVVRCFEDQNVAHVSAALDPGDDISTIETELMLSDIEILEKKIQKDSKAVKGQDEEAAARLRVSEKALEILNRGQTLRVGLEDPEDLAIVRSFDLITQKPMLLLANIDEAALSEGNPHAGVIQEAAKAKGIGYLEICGKLEAEIAELPPEERKDYLTEMGMEASGLEKLAKAGYELLDLITFLTVVGTEIRAWAVRTGTAAKKAAGKIHTDMERGFIKAEVIEFEELKKLGSLSTAREKGQIRLEGKDYIVKDGDVITFRFNI